MTRFWREYHDAVLPRSAADLVSRGVTRDVLVGPSWRRTSYGLYVPAADWTDPPTPTQRILSAWARLPAGSVLGGWAAAYALGVSVLDGVDPLAGGVLPVRAYIQVPLHRQGDAELRYLRERLPAAHTYEMAGIGWTEQHRTAFDLARWASDLTEAVAALDALFAARVVKRDRLLDRAERLLLRRRGAPQARRALELSRSGTRSPWESRLRMFYVLDLGLPIPAVNVPVFDLTGTFLAEIDLLDEEAGVAIEFDGRDHRQREQHRRDNVREELLERTRLLVVRVDSLDLRRHRRQLAGRLTTAREQGLRRDKNLDGWTTVVPPNWLGMPA